MCDEKELNTESNEIILKAFFDSVKPLHLITIPKKNNKRLSVMTIISQVFEDGVLYTEKEVNELIKPIYDDYAVIRRYLVDYSLLIRTKSGSVYRKA